MSAEDELRALLAAAADGRTGSIDTARVIRRSAWRHRARRAAVGGVFALAIVGVGVAGVAGVGGLIRSNPLSAASSGESVQVPGTSGQPAPAPAKSIDLCGGPLTRGTTDAAGLVLSVDFPSTADAAADSISGTVTLTNTGTERVTGSTAPTPVITLSRNGVVLWHSNGPTSMVAALVDLRPGASMTYPASFSPVRCDAEDEANGFRRDLPHVAAGDYQLSAAIDLSRADADGGPASNELVIGAPAAIHLN